MTRREMLGWPLLGVIGLLATPKKLMAPQEARGPMMMEVHGSTIIHGDLVVTGNTIERNERPHYQHNYFSNLFIHGDNINDGSKCAIEIKQA